MISREDEIREEANRRYPLKWCDVGHCYAPEGNSAFIEGAKWADEYNSNIWYDFANKSPMDMNVEIDIPLLFHTAGCELIQDQYFIATLDEFLHFDRDVIESVCEWAYLPLAERFESNRVLSRGCGCNTDNSGKTTCECAKNPMFQN